MTVGELITALIEQPPTDEVVVVLEGFYTPLVGVANSRDNTKASVCCLVANGGPEDYLPVTVEYSLVDPQAVVTCCCCTQEAPKATAHRHQGQWIGDECCWIEQLRSSE